jgi:hypothetical protein
MAADPILQNKFGGVNQRALRFEALDFFKFDGCWPQWAGIQSRMNGKALLELSNDSQPVYAIFQTFTPQGYSVGYYQTFSNVSADNWALAAPNINLNPLNLLPINGQGYTIGPLDTNYGFNSTSGLGGGTGTTGQYKITHVDYAVSSILSNLEYFTNSTSIPEVVIPIPDDEIPNYGYLPFQNATAITQTTPPTVALVASLDSSTTNETENNLSPPPNNNEVQNWASTAINTSGILNLTSSLLSTSINATLLATINSVNVEIPFNIPWSSIQSNPIISINTQQYIQPATIIQSAQNFDSMGDPVTVAPNAGPGLYGMKERNQSQNSTVTLNSVRVYSVSFVYG